MLYINYDFKNIPSVQQIVQSDGFRVLILDRFNLCFIYKEYLTTVESISDIIIGLVTRTVKINSN